MDFFKIKLGLLILVGSFAWAGDMDGTASKGTIYSPVGKRDPFRPPSSDSGKDVTSVNPLEKYSIDKFQLKGVLKGIGRPRAMFEDPDGRSFILSEGDTFGRERGTISRILNTEVIITEKTFNYLGAENLYERVLSLPSEDSLNEVDGGVKSSGSGGVNRGTSSGGGGSSSSNFRPQSAAPASAKTPSAASAPIGNSGNVTVQGGNVR